MSSIKRYARHLVRYLRGTRAVAAMEYAIIVGVVVVGVGLAVGLFQDEIVGVITDVTEDLSTTRTNIATDAELPAAGGGGGNDG